MAMVLAYARSMAQHVATKAAQLPLLQDTAIATSTGFEKKSLKQPGHVIICISP